MKVEEKKVVNPRRHMGEGHPPSIFMALNFRSLTGYQKLLHNCSFFLRHHLTLVKWCHDWWRHHNKSRNLCVDYEMQFFAKKATIFAKILITLQWILQFCRFQSLNVFFSALFLVFKFKYEKKLKIWKSMMAVASDVTMLLRLPWKPIRQQMVSISWKYKECSLYVSNI